MSAKTSFFNKKIFAKNIKDAMPIFLPIIALLLIVGINCTNNAKSYLEHDNLYNDVQKNLLAQYLFMDVTSTVIFKFLFVAYSFFCGTFVFRYLHQKKLSSTIHALPLTRVCLFVTNAISGFVIVVLPYLLTAVIFGIYLLIHGFGIAYLPLWFLITSSFCMIFYALAVLAAMLTGLLVATPIIYLVLNFGFLIIEIILRGIVSLFSFGLPGISDIGELSSMILTPFAYLWQAVHIRPLDMAGNSIQYFPNGPRALVIYAVASFAILAIGLLLYKHRKLETQGDPLVFNKLEPIFTYFGTFVGATMFAVILLNLFYVPDFSYLPGNREQLLLVVIFLVCSVVLYYIILMLLHKTIRVFKAHYKGIALYCCLMLAGILMIRLDVLGAVSKVPDLSDIRTAELYCSGNDINIQKEENLKKVQNLHKSIIKEKEAIIKELTEPSYSDSYYNLYEIVYQLKNGKTFTRSYYLPYTYSDDLPLGNASIALHKELTTLLTDKEFMLDHLGQLQSSLSYLTFCFLGNTETDTFSEDVTVDERYYFELIEAIKKDIQEGTLQYTLNTPSSTTASEVVGQYMLSLVAEGKLGERTTYTEYLVTKDCKNTLPLLKKLEEFYKNENLLEDFEDYED